jgi:uncharacterized membrane protein YkvA (DUF1232 family)
VSVVSQLNTWARGIKRDTYALYFAARDPRTPWYAKAFAAAIVAYALSPIDLIPDFIPILGYLDDLIIVPLGLIIAVKLVPAPVMAECRERAVSLTDRPTSRVGLIIIVALWLLLALGMLLYILDKLGVI